MVQSIGSKRQYSLFHLSLTDRNHQDGKRTEKKSNVFHFDDPKYRPPKDSIFHIIFPCLTGIIKMENVQKRNREMRGKTYSQ